jgi:dihydropteroate synthase
VTETPDIPGATGDAGTPFPGPGSPEGVLRLRDQLLNPDDLLVMAIVNRTPDSFFDRGRYLDDRTALDHVAQAVDDGADLVDVGGVRAGPGPLVTADEEIRRVVPFLARLRDRFPRLLLSVDTWRPEVAAAACSAGADLINDAWQGADPDLAGVAAEHGVGLVCSHAGGHGPRQDPHRVEYHDVVDDVLGTFEVLTRRAVSAGVSPDRILVDAAFDFGKNSYHSLQVARATDRLVATAGRALCVSNKKFVAESVGCRATSPGGSRRPWLRQRSWPGRGPGCSGRTMSGRPGTPWTWSPPCGPADPGWRSGLAEDELRTSFGRATGCRRDTGTSPRWMREKLRYIFEDHMTTCTMHSSVILITEPAISRYRTAGPVPEQHRSDGCAVVGCATGPWYTDPIHEPERRGDGCAEC